MIILPYLRAAQWHETITPSTSFGGISFGNFVFWDYGVILEREINCNADLYLYGEDSLQC
jgi:hypothetical protein